MKMTPQKDVTQNYSDIFTHRTTHIKPAVYRNHPNVFIRYYQLQLLIHQWPPRAAERDLLHHHGQQWSLCCPYV